MYQKECKWCSEIIVVEKQQRFASHVATCLMNPNLDKRKISLSLKFKGVKKVERISLKKTCPNCGDIFEIEATESEIRREKVKKYCSLACGNKRDHSYETRKKISDSVKGNIPHNKGIKKEIGFVCLGCGQVGIDKKYNTNRKYHKECWGLSSGGVREGSSRGKSGWYKGYKCDSSYELAYLVYSLENNIKIERNKKGFEYIYDGNKHLFYPDFIVNGEYVEIKNYRSELTDCKLKYFPHKIEIFYKDTIKPYIEYAINKYGKDYIKLYENKN